MDDKVNPMLMNREIVPTDAQKASRDLPRLITKLKALQTAMEAAKDELLLWKEDLPVWYEDAHGLCPAMMVFYHAGFDDDVTEEAEAPAFEFLYNLILSLENEPRE